MTMLSSIGALAAPPGGGAALRPVELEPIRPTTQKIGVLTFEAPKDLQSFAEDISTALRDQYRTAGYPLTEVRSFVEMKLVLCEGEENTDCLAAKVGKALHADQLILGNVKSDGKGGCIVTVKHLDVERKTIEHTFDITFDIVRPSDAKAAADLIYAKLTEVTSPPRQQRDHFVPPPSPEAVTANAKLQPKPRSYFVPMLIAGGAAVATAAVGAFFLNRGEQREDDWNELYGDLRAQGDITRDGNFSNSASERANRGRVDSLEEDAERDSTIGVVNLGIAGVAGVTAAVLGFLHFSGRRNIEPAVGLNEDGVSVGFTVYAR